MSLTLRARLIARLLPMAVPDASMSPEEQRARVERFAGRAGLGARTDSVRLGGIPATRVRPRRADPRRYLLHCHGGGYVIGTSRTFLGMVADLAKRTGTTAFSLDYRRAPEHPYPAAVDDCLAGYRGLVRDVPAEHVVLAGESAGANAVLATLVRARDEGLPMPAAAVLLSPWVDLTLSGESMARNRRTEIVLADDLLRSWRDAYVGDADPADPGVSPLFADLTGLPPLHVQATTAEVLEDDARRLVGRAQQAGVDVELVLVDELWHVFQTQAPLVPEASAALADAAAFVGRHLTGSTP